jgi:hypothetical protein
MDRFEIVAIGTAYYYMSFIFLMSLATAVVVTTFVFVARLREQGESKTEKGEKAPRAEKDQNAEGKPATNTSWVEFLRTFAYVLVVGFIGGLAGHLGGSSRVGVVGELVPALFTLLGGFSAYYFGTKANADGKLLANSAAFLLCFFASYNVASVWRQSTENWEFCKAVYSNAAYDEAGRADRDYWFNTFCTEVFKQSTEQTT